MKSVLRPVGGHILDIDSSELTPQVLSLANNVHMRKGFPSRIRGRRAGYTAASVDPVHMLNFSLNAFNWWLLFGASSIQAVETSNSHDITYVGQSSTPDTYEWSSTLLNGIPVFTNGLDIPHYWTGDSGDDALALPGWPANTACKFIVAFRFHLFALNIDGPSGIFDNLIMWSEATQPGAIPQSWTPLPSNEAGSAFCADTEGRCIAGVPLGTQLMIYKPGSIYAVEYAGQQPDNIFTVRPINRSSGLLAPHALKAIGPNQLVAVGNDDVTVTDGVNFRSIADNRIKRRLASSIDETNNKNVYTVYDSSARELWICIPETGSRYATVAHIWDEKRDNWVTRDLQSAKYSTFGYVNDNVLSQVWNDDSGTWDSDFSTWNEAQQGGKQYVVTADDLGIMIEDVPDSTTVNATLQRLDISFDDPEQVKVTTRVYIEGSGQGFSQLLFRLGARDSTDANIAWGPYMPWQAGGREYEVSGKFISIEITNDFGVQEWTVNRATIEAEYDGSF